MSNNEIGWGSSTVATKYIYLYLQTILDLGGDEELQNATAQEQLDYMCRELSELYTSLGSAYYADTGQKIGAKTPETPSSNYEALVLSLTLSITAPTEEKAGECLRMAEEYAANLNEFEVERAKREAKKKAEEMECEI